MLLEDSLPDSPVEMFGPSLCTFGNPLLQCPGPAYKWMKTGQHIITSSNTVCILKHLPCDCETASVPFWACPDNPWMCVAFSPADVNMADTATEVLKTAVWRASKVESLHGRINRDLCGWWRPFVLPFVFIIHHQRETKETDSAS